MTRFVFHVQGSAPEPYVVVIERLGRNLRATCDCQAGQMGQSCKHRFGLFEGNSKDVCGGDTDRVRDIPKLLEGTDVEEAFVNVKQAEKNEAAAKKQLQDAKKLLAKAMSD